MTEHEALKRAVELVKGQVRLATLMNVRQPTVSAWVNGSRPLPLERCVQIERLTFGHVTCEELSPLTAWRRVKTREWPWHPEGKPLVDVSPVEA